MFLLIALSTLSVLALITVFIFIKGNAHHCQGRYYQLCFWDEMGTSQGYYGIFPMIVGSVSVTIGAAIVGVPIAICCSIFLAEFAPAKLRNVFRPAIQLLAAIPSVVYGLGSFIRCACDP